MAFDDRKIEPLIAVGCLSIICGLAAPAVGRVFGWWGSLRRCIKLSHLIALGLSLFTAPPFVGWAQEEKRARKPKNDPVAVADLAGLQKLSLQQLFDAYSAAEYEDFGARHEKKLTKDMILTEVVRRAAPCEDFLKKELEATKKGADIFKGQNLELLTALRRIQKKPDPVTVDVTIPKKLEATTRNLPTFQVALKKVDNEKSTPVIAFGGDYRSGRQARWRFEIHDSKGNLLPHRDSESMSGGGMYTVGELRAGKEYKTSLRMEDFVKIIEPGEYTVRILYHDRQTIADLKDVTGLILCVSKPLKLKVIKARPKVIQVASGSRERALALVATLPENGPIRVVMGTYGSEFHKFIDPKSPEGQLHAMGWDAVPGLFDALRSEKLSPKRRGWVLAMLYVITCERDLNPFSRQKWSGVLPAYEYQGQGCTGSGSGALSREQQRELSDQWLKLKAEAWEFREAKK